MAKIKYTCEEYNIISQAHYDITYKLRHGKIKLICSRCKFDLEETKHVDDSKHPHKRQMICTNPDTDKNGYLTCGKIFYRNE